jgi:hypothetical protein
MLTWLVLLLWLGSIFAAFCTFYIKRSHAPDTSAQNSPLPCIADGTWAQLNPKTFLNERMPGKTPIVSNLEVVEVTSDDLERVPLLHNVKIFGIDTAHTQPLSKRDQINALRKTHSLGTIHNPTWPWCCERLGTLVEHHLKSEGLAIIEKECGPLEKAYLEREIASWPKDKQNESSTVWTPILQQIRQGRHEGQGVNIFACRLCQRVYLGSCGPACLS